MSFNDITSEYKEVHAKITIILSVVDLDEEEQEHDHVSEEGEQIEDKESKIQLKSQREFSALSNDPVCSVNRFCMMCHHNKKVEKELEWDAMHDSDSIGLGGVDFGSDVELRKDIKINPNDENLSELCFNYFFPHVKVHAKFIGGCYSYRRSLYHSLVDHKKIVFYHLEHVDPDRLVKTCCLIMIANVYEAQVEVANLWQRGRSNKRCDYTNFGMYVGQNYFKVFL